jgi:hypothetical protein
MTLTIRQARSFFPGADGPGSGPRRATTLVEVLVAIFVMGIGCLAILAMFPLGAINMTRSIRDDRCAHAAANARAIGMARNICFDANVAASFDSPNPLANPATHDTALPEDPSYPVFVDPVGSAAYSLPGRDWLGNLPAAFGSLHRQPLGFINTPQLRLKSCTLLDDITFNTNGTPAANAGSVERAGKYSWAWLLRRPRAGLKSLCEMTVVVYEQRTLSAGNRLGATETVYTTSWTPARANAITLTIPAGTVPPAVREGGWILDATPVLAASGKYSSKSHAKFYRVVSIGELQPIAGGNTIDLELATPVVDFTAATNAARFIVLNDVAEVFECGQVWKAWNS